MGDNFVKITVTSNVNSFHSDRTFPLSLTIAELKCKLELLTGVPASIMQLELRNADGKFISAVTNDQTTLNSYNIQHGFIIHVTGNTGVVADEGDVEKFVISDEAYEKRTDSVRAWKQKQGFGEFDPEYQKKKASEAEKALEDAKKASENIRVGQRCMVNLSNQPPKSGQVMYVGETYFKPGYWVGVQYDEPAGKHDGTVEGHRYFQCPDKYGSFVRPRDVTVGDFPPENLQEMDEF